MLAATAARVMKVKTQGCARMAARYAAKAPSCCASGAVRSRFAFNGSRSLRVNRPSRGRPSPRLGAITQDWRPRPLGYLDGGGAARKAEHDGAQRKQQPEPFVGRRGKEHRSGQNAGRGDDDPPGQGPKAPFALRLELAGTEDRCADASRAEKDEKREADHARLGQDLQVGVVW